MIDNIALEKGEVLRSPPVFVCLVVVTFVVFIISKQTKNVKHKIKENLDFYVMIHGG